MELSLSVSGIRPRPGKAMAKGTMLQPHVNAEQAVKVLEDKLFSRFKRVKDAFVKMDYDCDGYISGEEFRVSLDLIGLEMDDAEFGKLWRRFDTSGDGRISYNEFNRLVGALIHPHSDNLLRRPPTPRLRASHRLKMAQVFQARVKDPKKLFRSLDSDNTGTITQPQFLQLLKELGLSRGLKDDDVFVLFTKHLAPGRDQNEMDLAQFERTVGEFLAMDLGRRPAEERVDVDERMGFPSMNLSDAQVILGQKLAGRFAHVQRAFRKYDEDHSGALDYSEFKMMLRSLGVELSERDFTTIFKEFDPDRSGLITYREFNEKVGPMLHPGAANESAAFRRMEEAAGAQDGLVYDPKKKVGRHAIKRNPTAERLRVVANRSADMTDIERLIAQSQTGQSDAVAKAFRVADEGRTGHLPRDGVVLAMRSLGLEATEEQLDELFAKYDRGREGLVRYGDLIESVEPLLHLPGSPSNERRGLAPAGGGAGGGEGGVADAAGSRSARSTPRSLRASATAPELVSTGSRRSGARDDDVLSVASGASRRSRRSVAGRSVASATSFGSAAMSQTEAKMRRILGRSWKTVLQRVQNDRAAAGGGQEEEGAVSADALRDAMAEAGVPLTSKEMRAIERRFGGSGRGTVRSQAFMSQTFGR